MRCSRALIALPYRGAMDMLTTMLKLTEGRRASSSSTMRFATALCLSLKRENMAYL